MQERKRRSVLKWQCSAGTGGLQVSFRGTDTGTQVSRVEKYQIRDTWWSRDEHAGWFFLLAIAQLSACSEMLEVLRNSTSYSSIREWVVQPGGVPNKS